jgi:branched-subunit amino acid aminotransferase/4-amino-4-deoxychorismate lyase
MSIVAAEQRPIPSPFRITISPYPVNSRSPLAGVKSCNYLEQILAKDEAKKRGFDEAIRGNERGHVTSGCMANVFWLNGDRFYTPALSTGCLPGTTREFVLENLECEEVEAEIGDLETADAIFLTSAGLGIVAADQFDGRRLAGGDHPILQLWKDLETG